MVAIHDKTKALRTPKVKLGCGDIDGKLKPKVGHHKNQMNVYIVQNLKNPDRFGVACTKESDNVIMIENKVSANGTTLAHELGHWFDLWHTQTDADPMPSVNIDNVMSAKGNDSLFTAGQCYRIAFSKDSYINKAGLRTGETRKCEHQALSTNKCPGLQKEFE